MRGRKARFLFTLLLTLLVFGFGTRIVNADEWEKEVGEESVFETKEKSTEGIGAELLEEFDFKEVEKSVSALFPKEKISFEEVVSSFISGNSGEILETVAGYLKDEIAYEFLYSKKILIYVILIAVLAAVISNFA